MAWTWRVFIAPGDEDTPLPTSATSWHRDRMVRILSGHWDTIIQYAATIDPDKAEALDMLAQDHEGQDPPSADAISESLSFIDELIQRLEAARETLPYAEDDPDHFSNDVYVDMLQAVKAVFHEALRLHEPFQAWLD